MTVPVTSDLALDTAVRIGDALDVTAFWHGPSCNWIGPRAGWQHRAAPGTHRQAAALPSDLYFGTAGLAWYLYQLYRATRNPRYLALSQGALSQGALSRAALEHLPGDGSHRGLYLGAAGPGLVTAYIGHSEGDPALSQRGVDLAAGPAPATEAVDLLGGLAGELLACSVINGLHPSEALRSRAGQVAGALISRGALAVPEGASGMASGAPGVAYALAAWTSLSGTPAVLPSRPALHESADPHLRPSWCQGVAGVALSRLYLARASGLASGQGRGEGQAEAALRSTRRALARALVSGSQDFSLCHGFVGLAEVIRIAGAFFNCGSHVDGLLLRTAAQRCAAYITEISARGKPELGDEDLSLMLGISGVGSFLLGLAHPLSPSPLLLTTALAGALNGAPPALA
jgi:lantibiotic modifying enzyme